MSAKMHGGAQTVPRALPPRRFRSEKKRQSTAQESTGGVVEGVVGDS